MDNKTIFSKSAKGLREATGETSKLPRVLRNILKEIDGKRTLADLQDKFSKYSEEDLNEALKSLTDEGYIRETIRADQKAAAPDLPQLQRPQADDGGEDLDFTSLAQPAAMVEPPVANRPVQNETLLKQQAIRAKEEADARLKAEAQVRASKLKEELARQKAETQARLEAEEKARIQAEAKTRQIAEEKAKREALDRAKKEADEKARREAEVAARAKAEAMAKAQAEARAKREAEELIRRELEEKLRKEAAEKRGLRQRLGRRKRLRKRPSRKSRPMHAAQRKSKLDVKPRSESGVSSKKN